MNIVIAYDDESGGSTARKHSEFAAHKIGSLFEKVYGVAEDATTIIRFRVINLKVLME